MKLCNARLIVSGCIVLYLPFVYLYVDYIYSIVNYIYLVNTFLMFLLIKFTFCAIL